MDEELKSKLFHIFEDLIDMHIKAYMEEKIVESCYIDKPIDKAVQAVERLLIEAKIDCLKTQSVYCDLEMTEKAIQKRIKIYQKQLTEIGGGNG